MAERKMKTKEERLAEIDEKIKHHQKCIDNLTKQKESILNPKPRNRRDRLVSSIVAMAKEHGMTDEEIAERLGVKLGE